MKYYLTGAQAGLIDRYTQDKVGFPGLVLMEKAAETAAQELECKLSEYAENFDKSRDKILIVAESGNNGGDGVAVARILKTHGYNTFIYEINGISSKSDSYLKQVEIAKNLEVDFVIPDIEDEAVFDDYMVIVDSIFGVGLTREVKGIHSKVIDRINHAGAGMSFVFSIDIPSGISSSTGHVLGNAVRSHMTVTFQYEKLGMLENEGREYSGKIVCRDIGLYVPSDITEMERIFESDSIDGSSGTIHKQICYEYSRDDVRRLLPDRKADSNKGTYGKVLIFAGSRDVYGALYMTAESALRVGAGLVKVVTDIRNRDILSEKLPEAMMLTYDVQELSVEESGGDFYKKLAESVKWADVILAGPGIGTESVAEEILKYLIDYCGTEKRILNEKADKKSKKLILDADALNIISKNTVDWFDKITDAFGRDNIVITPHIAEMSRLVGKPVSEVKEKKAEIAHMVSDRYGTITVLKDARTYVTAPDECSVYVNTTGNSGMSTGGSGDVLAGISAGIAAQMDDRKLNMKNVAALAVNLHGRAGNAAREKMGERGMTATDILVAICRDIC